MNSINGVGILIKPSYFNFSDLCEVLFLDPNRMDHEIDDYEGVFNHNDLGIILDIKENKIKILTSRGIKGWILSKWIHVI